MSLPAPGAAHAEYSLAALREYDTLFDAAEDVLCEDLDANAGEDPDVPVPEGVPFALHPAPFGMLCREVVDDLRTDWMIDPQALHLLQAASEEFMKTVYKAGLASGGDSDSVVRDGIASMCARHGPGCACCVPKSPAPKRARKMY